MGFSSGTKRNLRLSLTATVPWVLVREAGLLVGDEELCFPAGAATTGPRCPAPVSWVPTLTGIHEEHPAGLSQSWDPRVQGTWIFTVAGDLPALALEEDTFFVSQALYCTNILEKIMQKKKKGSECLACNMCRSERPQKTVFWQSRGRCREDRVCRGSEGRK